MRKFGWASPRELARLTDRQIWSVCFMRVDDEGNLIDDRQEALLREEMEAAAKERAKQPRTRWRRYQDFLMAGALLATSKAEMVRQWAALYGAPPTPDED